MSLQDLIDFYDAEERDTQRGFDGQTFEEADTSKPGIPTPRDASTTRENGGPAIVAHSHPPRTTGPAVTLATPEITARGGTSARAA